jgi:hypothetical protein
MWRLELVDHDGFQRPCFFSSQRDSSSARRHCVFSAVSSMREQRSLTALRPSLPAQGSSLAAFCPFLLLCGLAWRRTFFSGAVVSRGILGAPCFFFPLLWSAAAWRRISLFFGLACCNAQVAAVLHASRHLHAYLDAGAWHVQQLARVVRKPAALQRLRQPAAPPSIFFLTRVYCCTHRAAAVRTAAWRRFCTSPPPEQGDAPPLLLRIHEKLLTHVNKS